MRKPRFTARLVPLLLCAALLLGGVSACASSKSSRAPGQPMANQAAAGETEKSYGTADTAAASQPAENGAAFSPAAQAAQAQSKQKIIERLSYQMETLKFDESVTAIQRLCADLGGYVQDSNVDGSALEQKSQLRTAKFTLRIPQEKLADWKSRAGKLATVLNFTSSSENVSDKYYDTEARLKSLRTQQERLLALLGKSGSMSDIVTLEKALEDVNYQIEQLTGALRQYDSQIDYSTVSVALSEVLQPTEQTATPVTLGQKISQQFRYSLRGLGSFGEGLLIFFLGNAPALLLLALIATVILLAYRRGKKRRSRRERAVPGEMPGPAPQEPHGGEPREK